MSFIHELVIVLNVLLNGGLFRLSEWINRNSILKMKRNRSTIFIVCIELVNTILIIILNMKRINIYAQ